MKRTAIYARYSSDNQRTESIDEQVRACRYFAQQTGEYDIIAVYKDEALSGYKNIHKRDGFSQLMADAEAGKFEAVMVYELSRFSRNGSDTIVYTEKLAKLDIEFVSVRERLDRTPEGRMMMYVITGMNEYYSANLAIEVMRGLKENAYNAKHTGGTPPLGYDLDKDGHYIINPLEAAAVRLIYEMYLAGNGYTPIIDALNAAGYKTKRGGCFGKNSLYDLLRNEKYTGTFVYNRTEKVQNGRQNRHKYKDDADVIRVPNAFPAIITNEEYKEVMKRMKEQAHKGARNKAKRDYLLSGKVYCGHCGKAMHGDTRTRKGYQYAYYTCGNHSIHQCDLKSVKADLLEAEVIRQLNSTFFTPEVCTRVAEKIMIMSAEPHDEMMINDLRRQSAALKKKIDNGTKAILDGVDSDELREAVKECSRQKKAIDSRILELESAVDNADRTVEEFEQMFKECADIGKLPPEQQRKIIEKLVWRIYVYANPDDSGYHIKIVLAPTEQAKDALKDMAGDYVALTDFLSDMDGGALPLPRKSSQLRRLRAFTFSSEIEKSRFIVRK